MNIRDSVEGIAVFVAAAEAGSFVKAAEQLALSRSAVGKTVARLEERLGVRLFHRTTRSQSLTEEGEIYYERCTKALNELREAEALLDNARHEVNGRLRVTMPLLFGRYCVAPILLELAKQYEELELDLHFSDHTVDIIDQGFDLAIRNHRPGSGTALESIKLVTQRKVICAAPSYLKRYGSPDSPGELQYHASLVFCYKGQLYPWTFCNKDGSQWVAPLTYRMQFNSYDVIADVVTSGLGIACLPDWLIRKQLSEGTLVQLMKDYPLIEFETYAVWPSAKYQPLKLRAAISSLLEKLTWVNDLSVASACDIPQIDTAKLNL
ncbi:LysR substrate-binding domain-containing protein [Kluyvera ascorbata]